VGNAAAQRRLRSAGQPIVRRQAAPGDEESAPGGEEAAAGDAEGEETRDPVQVAGGAPPPPPSAPVEEEATVQPQRLALARAAIQRNPLAPAVAAGSVLQEAAAGFEILRSTLSPLAQGDLQVTWPNTPVGVTWPAKPAGLRLTALTRDALIFSYRWTGLGIEKVNVRLRCHVQFDGAQVQATFSFDAEGRRSRLMNDTSVIINNPLSLETRQAPEAWRAAGVQEYPVVRIPFEVRVDHPWPRSNFNYTANLILSGMYGWGAAPGEMGVQNEREVYN
jgi:hypothetical protein